MAELAARGALILIALGGAYVIAFWFVLVVWTFRDIESRSRSVVTQVFSTLMVVLFFVPGVLLYMILRPKDTLDEAFQRSLEEEYLLQDLEELPLCQSCHRYVEDDFVLCPNCHAQLREPCVGCARLVDLRWALCPYCASVQHGREAAPERVETPAARWLAPSVRRRRLDDEPVVVPGVGAPAADLGDDEGLQPAAAAMATTERAPGSEPVREPVAEPTPSPFTFVSGMRSIVRPLDRFRPRPAPTVEAPIDDGVATVQHDLPHVAFYGQPTGDGAVPNPLPSTATVPIQPNGNGRFGHRPETNGHANNGPTPPFAASDRPWLEPVAVGAEHATDEESAHREPELAVSRGDHD